MRIIPSVQNTFSKIGKHFWIFCMKKVVAFRPSSGGITAAKHMLCARCGEVGFIAGGDRIEIAGKKGKYTEEEIEPLSRKWWEYWKNYWRLRGTRDALPEDYACEVTIPVSKDDPEGKW